MAPHAETAEQQQEQQQQQKPTEAPPSPTNKSLTHLASYPLVASSLNTFTSHPLGQRTITLSHTAYSTFIAPLSPYLSAAYPYVNAADDFADSNLVKIETRFPIVKEPTENIKKAVQDGMGYPRKVAAEVIVRGSDFAKEKREYVFRVFEEEVGKDGSKGVVGGVKAGVTTGLVVSSELMNAVAGYLGRGVEKGQEATNGEAGQNGDAAQNGEQQHNGNGVHK